MMALGCGLRVLALTVTTSNSNQPSQHWQHWASRHRLFWGLGFHSQLKTFLQGIRNRRCCLPTSQISLYVAVWHFGYSCCSFCCGVGVSWRGCFVVCCQFHSSITTPWASYQNLAIHCCFIRTDSSSFVLIKPSAFFETVHSLRLDGRAVN